MEKCRSDEHEHVIVAFAGPFKCSNLGTLVLVHRLAASMCHIAAKSCSTTPSSVRHRPSDDGDDLSTAEHMWMDGLLLSTICISVRVIERVAVVRLASVYAQKI